MVSRLKSGRTHAAAAFVARETMAIIVIAYLLSTGRI